MALASVTSSGFSIARKLNLAGGLLAVVVCGLVVLALGQARDLERERVRAAETTVAMRNNIEADMMHDAMRSTVLAAQIGALRSDASAIANAEKDLAEYRGWLDRLRQSNESLDLSDDTKAILASVSQSFVSYEAQVEDMVRAARQGPQAIEAQMPAFLATFESMEVRNEAASDKIAAEVEAASLDVAARVAMLQRVLAMLAGLVLVLVIGFVLYVRRSIVRPVVLVADSLSDGANIDLRETAERADEIGQLARSADGFRQASQLAREAEAQRAAAEALRAEQAEAEMRRREALNHSTAELQERVIAISRRFATTTTQLKSIAQALAASADKSRAEASSAVGSAEQSLTSVVAIAEATDELLVSINEISRGVSTAARSTGEVRVLSDSAKQAMGDLNGTTHQVSRVSVLIGDIAARTRMLALNATIEATHAGEAGRGFAVVAQEVKQLATQTASAVAEIDQLVKTMAGTTDEASRSIESVWSAIDNLSEVTTAIASAADQQGSAASEIGRTIHVTSKGSEDVRHTLLAMGGQVEKTAESAQIVLDAALDLERQAAELTREIDAFSERTLAA